LFEKILDKSLAKIREDMSKKFNNKQTKKENKMLGKLKPKWAMSEL
jgi:hypothetical protein